MQFTDETGFERYLKANGWELIPYDYGMYLSSMGTIGRAYKKHNKNIIVGLVDSGIGIYHSHAPVYVKTVSGGKRSTNSLPVKGFETALAFHSGECDTFLRGEILNDI